MFTTKMTKTIRMTVSYGEAEVSAEATGFSVGEAMARLMRTNVGMAHGPRQGTSQARIENELFTTGESAHQYATYTLL